MSYRIMQKIVGKSFFLITLGSLLLSNNAFAVTIKFLWDATDPAPEGYEVYERREGENYNYSKPIYRGAKTFCTKNLDDDMIAGIQNKEDITRYFVVRAFAGSQFSKNSNEVSYNPNQINTDDSDEGPIRKEVSTLWPNDEKEVDLAPVLIISSKADSLPHTIVWQISTEEDMSQIVLSIPTTDQNLSFQVPEMVLDTDTQYFWRAKIYDENGVLIDRTGAAPFLTIPCHQSDDKNSDGIPDHQKLQEESDLDNDGVSDSMQADFLCVKTTKGNGKIGVKSLSANATLASIKTVDDINYSNSINKPEIMNYGLVSFKLFLNNDTDRAEVGVFFSEPVAEEADWFKYDLKDGWTVMNNAVFSDDRKSIIFTIVDGGFGDEDGVKNGIIVDPLGIGIMSQTQNSTADISNASNSDSCYIDTLTSNKKLVDSFALHGLWKIFIGIFMIGIVTLLSKYKKDKVSLLARYNK